MDIKELKSIYKKDINIINSTPSKTTSSYLETYIEHIDDIPVLREAYALYAQWSVMDLFLFPEEKICGFVRCDESAGFHYGGGTWIDYNKAEDQEKVDLINSRRYHAGRNEDYTPEEMKSINACAATSTWFGGHMVLDYETVLSIGLNGYLEKINKHEKNSFYTAMEIMLNAVQNVISRFAEKAKTYSDKMYSDLKHIENEPPSTFTQAIQLVWILHMLNGSDSFGRFDFYLKPFFESDIENGVLTLEEAYELIIDFWFKLDSVNQIQNMTIGGSSNYTELTKLCIKATAELGYKGPNLCLRVSKDMPEEIWSEALNCIGTGIGLPALYNDELYINTLLKYGYEEKYALNYCFAGCSQLMIPGLCNFLNDIGIFNAAKIAEITLNNGFDIRTNEQVGLLSGKPEDFNTFEEILLAYKKQLDYFCDLEVSIHNKEYKYRSEHEGYAMRTLFIGDCLKNGKGVFEGGARFNNTELEIIGLTNAADHLYAIKKLVFDEKLVTLKEFTNILNGNWKNREDLREQALKVTKYGNDDKSIDEIRADITRHVYSYFNNSKSGIGEGIYSPGGIYVPGEVIFVAHDYCGSVTGATADGRYAYTVLADSAGASQGCDLNGPTALINSVLKLPVSEFLLTSVITNIKFTSHVFENERTISKIKNLFKYFFNEGGMQLQINVCNADTLKKAQENPSEYASLVIRVGGYSDYFVNISKSLQDEIILRAEHEA